MKLASLLTGKALVATLISVTLVGGSAAVFAATPVGQNIVHTVTFSAHPTTTATTDSTPGAKPTTGHDGKNHSNGNNQNNTCPGLPDVQKLATKYKLSTDIKNDALLAICALHQGTFTGNTPDGTSISTKKDYGYGEIDQLLIYAQYLATHDKSNTSGALTDSNAQSYLALALQNCGTTSLEVCLKTKVPGAQQGNGNGNGSGSDNGNNNGHDGKPTGTPSPSPSPSPSPTPHK